MQLKTEMLLEFEGWIKDCGVLSLTEPTEKSTKRHRYEDQIISFINDKLLRGCGLEREPNGSPSALCPASICRTWNYMRERTRCSHLGLLPYTDLESRKRFNSWCLRFLMVAFTWSRNETQQWIFKFTSVQRSKEWGRKSGLFREI